MFSNLGAYKELRTQWNAFYGLVTGDKEYLRQNVINHRKRGSLRSGEGTPEQAAQRQRLFEEREHI